MAKSKAGTNGVATVSAPEIIWKGPDALRPFLRPLGELYEDPANVNGHEEPSIAGLAASYSRFGQQKFLVGDSSGVVRDGNGQLRAAARLSWTHVAYSPSDLQGIELAAYALAINKLAELSKRDPLAEAELLRALQSEDFPLEAVGYDAGEVDALIEGLAREHVAGSPDGPAGEAGDVVDDPAGEWQGMPEYQHEDLTPARSIHVHFKGEDEVRAFAELVGQTITDKTRFLWYPQQEIIRYGDVE